MRVLRHIEQVCGSWFVVLLLAISLSVNVYTVHKLRYRPGRAARPLALGTRMTNLTAKDLHGAAVSINWASDSRPWILYMFSPSCVWCERNLDNIRALGETRKGQYRFVGLSTSGENLEAYLRSVNLPFPVYEDPREANGKRFVASSTPQTVMIWPDGVVRNVWLGAYVGQLQKRVEGEMGIHLPGLRAAVSSGGAGSSAPSRSAAGSLPPRGVACLKVRVIGQCLMLKLKSSLCRRARRFPPTVGMVAVSLFALAVASGQTPQPVTSFDVASVKRCTSEPAFGTNNGIGKSGIRFRNYALKYLLTSAYGVKVYQVIGPAWLETESYDVVATAPKGSGRSQIMVMFQNLLAERFQIRLHRETRDFPGFALVVGKNGPRLKKFADETGARANPELVILSSSGHIEARSVPALCNVLAGHLNQPVLDMTGITGLFDIKLDASPDLPGLTMFREPGEGADVSSSHDPPQQASLEQSIFTAVKELGLNLERRRVPLECIVIDKAEKVPTPN